MILLLIIVAIIVAIVIVILIVDDKRNVNPFTVFPRAPLTWKEYVTLKKYKHEKRIKKV